MSTIETIQYLQDHWEDIDPSDFVSRLVFKIAHLPPPHLLEYLMSEPPEGGAQDRTPEDWKGDVENNPDVIKAAETILDWIEAKMQGEIDAEAFQQYLREGPDKATYNSTNMPT
jgi:hypothetical protein